MKPWSPRFAPAALALILLMALTLAVVAAPPVDATTKPGDSEALDPPSALMVVLDVSGSMAETGATGGGTRLDGAKVAAAEFIRFVDQAAPGTRMGLSAYPDDDGCTVDAPEIPVQDIDPETMDAAIGGLTARGNTPTGLALQEAGEHLTASGERNATILLVSDGESNCESTSPDPCEVAQALTSKGVDVTVNTVGFQISDSGRSQLQCVADATGGTYVSAGDVEALQNAFAEQALPELKVDLDYDQIRTLRTGVRSDVPIGVTVTNAGRVTARDVQATITYDADFSPGAAQPRVRLGNLPAGATTTFVWRFRPPSSLGADLDDGGSRTVAFTVRAFAVGGETATAEGEIRLQAGFDRDDLPSWLTGAKHIVVMGDSYSSGEGAGYADPSLGPAFDEPTDEPYNTCHRAGSLNYGGRLKVLAGLQAEVTTIACSGAVTSDVFLPSDLSRIIDDRPADAYQRADGTRDGAPLASQVAQLRQLDAAPDLIVLTLGGNDLHFEETVKHCIAQEVTKVGTSCIPAARKILDDSLPSLGERLLRAYRSIEREATARAGHAVPILVLAYPIPFPTDATTPCSVGIGDIAFRPANRAFLNHFVTTANGAIAAEVEERRTQDHLPIYFVDQAALAYQDGNTYCDTDPWINRATYAGTGAALAVKNSNELRDASWWQKAIVHVVTLNPFLQIANREWRDRSARWGWMNMAHPNREGYDALARAVLQWSVDHPSLAVDAGQAAASKTSSAKPLRVDLGSGQTWQLQPGGTVLVTASGFAPGSSVALHLHSRPEALGTTRADDRGVAHAIALIRNDTPLGGHDMVATGIDRSGKPREVDGHLVVAAARPAWLVPIALATALFVLIALVAAAIWWRSAPRPNTSS